MSKKTQHAAILKALKAGRTLTAYTWAQGGHGVKLSTRCGELIEQGIKIEKGWRHILGTKVRTYRLKGAA